MFNPQEEFVFWYRKMTTGDRGSQSTVTLYPEQIDTSFSNTVLTNIDIDIVTCQDWEVSENYVTIAIVREWCAEL